MTRVVEDRHPGEFWLLWRLGNLTAIDGDVVRSIGAAWMFKESGRWIFRPRRTGNAALFYNAVLFVRLCWPFGLFWTVRWAATGTRAYWQAGLGWKLNGRFGLLFRVQGDAAAAQGVTGPNVSQSTGFEFGTH